jgi:hypothetical protein
MRQITTKNVKTKCLNGKRKNEMERKKKKCYNNENIQ